MNRFGLSRRIPAPIKRTVRQECHFGCILCGEAVYDYEHIEDFSKVDAHRPQDMALLCGRCHDQVTRGLIAKATVRQFRARPYRARHPWPRSAFYPNASSFPIVLGGAEFIRPRTALRVFGRELLVLREPEAPDGPVRISGEFYDSTGAACFQLDDNAFAGNPEAWDIETRGNRITIRRAPREIALRVRLDPMRLVVERLDMFYQGVRVRADTRGLEVLTVAGQKFRLSGRVELPDTGIDIVTMHAPDGIAVKTRRRAVHLLGSGGDYRVTGSQPRDTDVRFYGSARRLVLAADANITVGGSPPTPNLGLALSQGAALSLSLGELEVRIGSGATRSTVTLI